MNFKEYAPVPVLQPYVDRFWIVETFSDDLYPMEHALTPNGMDGIIFLLYNQIPQNFIRNNISQPLPDNYGLIQPLTHWRLCIPGPCLIVGVFFKPAVLHRWLRYPMYELTGQPIDMEAVLGREITGLNEQLSEKTGDIIQILEAFLISRLPVLRPTVNTYADYATSLLIQQKGRHSIQLLAAELKVSRQFLARQFADKVGISPKHFGRVVRFNAMHRTISAKVQPDWLDMVCQFGYYDQAHLIKDFHDFIGWSPTDYLHAPTEAADFYAGKP